MTTETAPFDSLEQLADAFAAGLHRMLEQDQGMGAFILVLANALSDPALHRQLDDRLVQRYRELVATCRAQLERGESPPAPVDDLLVFLKLMAVGYEQLAEPQAREADGWQLQFNLLRSFRPERATAEVIRSLHKPFNPAGFHFAKPFLAAETFWRGEFQGRSTALLYNKFPFMPLHGLWVPEPANGLPQYLDEAYHRYAWSVCAELARRIPGIGLAYNSLGAGASVNHLHFQLFVSARPLPLETDRWAHNGGAEPYPVSCLRCTDADAAWSAIQACHRQNLAYNLLYRGSDFYLLRRRYQGDFERQPWLSGMGWDGVCGSFVLFDRQRYLDLRPDQVKAQLEALQP